MLFWLLLLLSSSISPAWTTRWSLRNSKTINHQSQWALKSLLVFRPGTGLMSLLVLFNVTKVTSLNLQIPFVGAMKLGLKPA